MHARIPALVMLAFVLLQGCATTRHPGAAIVVPEAAVVPQHPQAAAGASIAERALAFVGIPYRFGGNGPDAFDCSGLVRFVFAEQGVTLPRTSEAQYAAGQPVRRDELLRGDLLFFRIPQPHIGIYVGDGRFVHAPSTGRAVSVAQLDEPWYARALVGAARIAVPPREASGSPPAPVP